MNRNERIGERLREVRKRHGMSQEELGKHIGVKKAAVSAIESGATRLNTDQLSTLSELFNVPMSYLLCESDITEKSFSESVIEEIRSQYEKEIASYKVTIKTLSELLGKPETAPKSASARRRALNNCRFDLAFLRRKGSELGTVRL